MSGKNFQNHLCQLPIHDFSPQHFSFANLYQIWHTNFVPRQSLHPSRVELWELWSVIHHQSEFNDNAQRWDVAHWSFVVSIWLPSIGPRRKWVFMSKPTFNTWYVGEAKKQLKEKDRRIIKGYIKMATEKMEETKEDK